MSEDTHTAPGVGKVAAPGVGRVVALAVDMAVAPVVDMVAAPVVDRSVVHVDTAGKVGNLVLLVAADPMEVLMCCRLGSVLVGGWRCFWLHLKARDKRTENYIILWSLSR
jgi:hypothetical protein